MPYGLGTHPMLSSLILLLLEVTSVFAVQTSFAMKASFERVEV